MKKYIITLLLTLCLLTGLALTAFAVDSTNSTVTDGTVTEDVAAGDTVIEPPQEESVFAQVQAWISENFSGLAVAIAAIYAIIPKVGGVSMVLKAINKLVTLCVTLKTYIADEKNENSIYNVLKRQGDTLTRFMNDIAPTLEAMEADKQETAKLAATLDASMTRLGKMCGVLVSVEEALELMATEFSDLISISTTVSTKQKAKMEADWMEKIEHLRATVKEAAYVEQGEEENT